MTLPVIQQVVSNNDMAEVLQTARLYGISDTAIICFTGLLAFLVATAAVVYCWRLYVVKTCFGCKAMKELKKEVKDLSECVDIIIEDVGM